MITALYAALLGAWMVALSIGVIKQRKSHQISLGDGGVGSLQMARSAQTNAMEYIPITLIMMMLAEYNGVVHLWLHLAGVVFCIGRVAHAKAILSATLKWRVRGMLMTFFVMVLLVILNLVYLPYSELF